MGKDRPRRARHRILQFGAKTAGFLGVRDARGSDAVTLRLTIISTIVVLNLGNSWWRRLERKLQKSARRRRLVKRCPRPPARRRRRSAPPRKVRPRTSAA